MDITQTTHVREILLVKPSAETGWVGHQRKITITSGAPFPIPDQYGDPEPLDPAAIGDVLPPAFVDLMAERDAAISARNTATEALAAIISERDAALANVTSMTAARDAADAAVAAKSVELQAMTGARDLALEQLADKTAECAAGALQIATLQAQLAAMTTPTEE